MKVKLISKYLHILLKNADECENIIKRSREFAEKNPDYLSDKIDINISFYLGSELIAIKFTNITNAPGDEKSIFYYDLTKLNMDCGEKPSYTYVDYSILQDKVLRPVIEILYPSGKPELVCLVFGIIPEANTLYASMKYDMFSDDICHVVLHLYVFFLLAFLLQNQ